ncbi:MAG: 3-oxoacyl-ACP reductase FabG [Ruminococcus sp.]|nr:3-oxoacyl-ACP reductase FabG [Ruminococcus sp.]
MKTALVTGGTGGIGQAICRKLADNGYCVIINYLHAEEKARRLADDINGKAVKFDVSDVDSVNNVLSDIIGSDGKIDLLVNNAGISEIDLFTTIPREKSDSIININLGGTLNCSRAVLPYMIRRKTGCIVNISSMWGQVGASCEVDYSASKAGIIGFTKALAKEVAPSGIRVNCVSPGFIMTEMNSRFTDEELDGIKEEIPLGFFGTPEHVADAVAFLSSESAEYITGQVLAVNGGMVI